MARRCLILGNGKALWHRGRMTTGLFRLLRSIRRTRGLSLWWERKPVRKHSRFVMGSMSMCLLEWREGGLIFFKFGSIFQPHRCWEIMVKHAIGPIAG